MAEYVLTVTSDNERDADIQARSLTEKLREIREIDDVNRIKGSDRTMDLGTVISVLATSGATLALAQGIADWLRSRRSTTVTVERDSAMNSIKATVENIDPESAERIIESIRRA